MVGTYRPNHAPVLVNGRTILATISPEPRAEAVKRQKELKMMATSLCERLMKKELDNSVLGVFNQRKKTAVNLSN